MNLRSLIEKGRTPVARKRTANAAVRWMMWRPERTRTAFYTIAGVLTALVASYIFRGVLWLDEATAARPAPAATTSTDPAPRWTAGPALITPTPTRSTTAPTPTVEPDPEKAPRAAAAAFLRAWTSGRTGTQKAWLAKLRPLTGPDLWRGFASTDRTRIPAGPVRVLTSITVPELRTSRVSATVGAGTVTLALTDRAGRWVVDDVAPE